MGGHRRRELAGAKTLSAFEHHVLKSMGHTRNAIVFVGRADAVPDLYHRNVGAMVFLHDQFQTVVERVFMGERSALNR